MASRIAPPSFQQKDPGQFLENDCGAKDLKIKVERSEVSGSPKPRSLFSPKIHCPPAFLQNNDEIPVIAMDLRDSKSWKNTGIRVEEWWSDSSNPTQALSGFRAW